MNKIFALLIPLTILVLASCGIDREPPPEGVLVVSQEQQASWVRNFNPLTTATPARWPTGAGVYEPLYVFNSVKSEHVPWLAVDYEWSEDKLELRMAIRQGVLWSDGEAFSAHDVAFTFNLAKAFPALDRGGVWRYLESVEATGDDAVSFRFQRVFVPGFAAVAAQVIVPEHIWGEIEDPVSFSNENPVATGPFTEVRLFRNQVYELGRNPHYWQEGKPAVEALRFPAYPSNDRANLALVFDEVDWAGNFIPAVDRVYVERDPEHHHYWFPLTGSCIFLYANTTRPDFADRRVRQAISMAIDRELLVDIALYRYSRPADVTGLSDAFTAWRDSTASAAGFWTQKDLDRANAFLDEVGFERGEDGIRIGADGEPCTYDILTVSGWSDWVRAAQVIARNLEHVGIDASVKTYDFSAWFQRLQEGDFDLSLGWSYEGATPYLFYRWLMSTATLKPVGEASPGNWHRYGSEEADRVLEEFERASEFEEQHRLAAEMQRIFVAEAPAIPLYPNPSWAEFNTSRFEGFPTEANPYADPSPNKFGGGECLLVLTNLTPRQAGE